MPSDVMTMISWPFSDNFSIRGRRKAFTVVDMAVICMIFIFTLRRF